MILDDRGIKNYTMISSHLYLLTLYESWLYKCVYICYIYIYWILPLFFFLSTVSKLTGWSMRRMFLPHIQLRVSVCFLCVSVNNVRISLCFWRKSNIPWKARRIEGLCLQWGNRFSQLVCFILLRLTSMWALYTLKWTLVTLVLMGHYLTYESLRHNQLYFTFKDHLSNGRLSLLPASPPHTFQG